MNRHEQLRERALAFHRAHPEVMAEFCRLALNAIERGVEHWGAKGVMEVVRWKLEVEGGQVFKINNNFTAFYARGFERKYPEHKGFFEFREQTSARTTARIGDDQPQHAHS